MKANEAPEKLYFDVNNNLIGLYDSAILGMYSAKNTETSIEYTRTDAFIEKVSGWLKDCATFTDMNGKKRIDKEMYKATVEDFENYMKGE